MRLTIERDVAAAAMARVNAIVLRTTTLPILQDVVIEAADGRATFRGCDLDLEMVAGAPAAVAEAGAVAVPSQRLHDLLSTLPAGGQVTFDAPPTATRASLSCGRSRFQLPILPASDFPAFDKGSADHQAEIPAKVLARLLAKTSFAVCREKTRYYITGLYLHTVIVDGSAVLRTVGTDGGCLALAECPCPEGWEKAPGVSLPLKTVGELARLAEGDGMVSIWTNGRLFGVETPGGMLASKVIDAAYPDYARVIPRDPPLHVAVDVVSLLATVKRCMVMTADRVRGVRLSLRSGELEITACDGQGGEAAEVIEVAYDGEPLEVGFPGPQLLAIAGQMAGETLTLQLGGPADPAKMLDPHDSGSVYVAMPLRA